MGPTMPPMQCIVGDISPGVKRQGLEADRLTTYCAEVKAHSTIRFHGEVHS
jgi:hypothetical protein